MSKTYLPYGPDQQWLPDDHLAHFISGVMDQVDLSDITTRHEREMRGWATISLRLLMISSAVCLLLAMSQPPFCPESQY